VGSITNNKHFVELVSPRFRKRIWTREFHFFIISYSNSNFVILRRRCSSTVGPLEWKVLQLKPRSLKSFQPVDNTSFCKLRIVNNIGMNKSSKNTVRISSRWDESYSSGGETLPQYASAQFQSHPEVVLNNTFGYSYEEWMYLFSVRQSRSSNPILNCQIRIKSKNAEYLHLNKFSVINTKCSEISNARLRVTLSSFLSPTTMAILEPRLP